MEKKLAPVVLFVFNRPMHTYKTIQALALNKFASQTDLIIYADGSALDSDKVSVELTRKMLSEIQGFKSIKIHCSDTNFGLAASIIQGVTKTLETYHSVIVLEDDLETSSQFLEYMNFALDYYQDSSVYSISGYTPPISIPTDYPYTTYLTSRICSWGWATWREKWQTTDWQVTDFDQFIRTKEWIDKFNQSGNDLTPMLLRYKIGAIKSWAIRFAYHTFKNDGYSVYPVKSLVRNSGADGSGTNMKASSKYDVELYNSLNLNNLSPINNSNSLILKSFRDFYNTSYFRSIINWFKRLRYIGF